MNNPLISVILPIYNVEKYLEKSIKSVINQTYKNLEIILVNDGSPDKSLEICEKFQEQDNRIKIINKENGGLSDARNAGLDIAKGDYISLIDSDDFVESHFIEHLLNLIIKYDADISECWLEKVNEEDINTKEIIYTNNNNVIELNNLEALKRIHNDDFDICLRSVVVWNKLYKRQIFDDIRYPKGKLYEDEFTTYKLFYKAKKIVFSDEKLYAYVQRNNSIINQKFRIKRLDALEAYDNYLEFFTEKKLFDMQARTCMRYTRILAKIKEEVINSDYEEKEKVFDILNNKMNEVCSILEQLLNEHKELEYRKDSHKVFVEKFYSLDKNIKV